MTFMTICRLTVTGTTRPHTAGIGSPIAGWVTTIIRGPGWGSDFGGTFRGPGGAGSHIPTSATLTGSAGSAGFTTLIISTARPGFMILTGSGSDLQSTTDLRSTDLAHHSRATRSGER